MSGYIFGGKIFEILVPALLIILFEPKKIEPTPIASVKNIKTKPIKRPENQACWDPNGATSLLAKVNIEKFGESNIPVNPNENVRIKELVHLPL